QLYAFFRQPPVSLPALHSFPTRRSSDLDWRDFAIPKSMILTEPFSRIRMLAGLMSRWMTCASWAKWSPSAIAIRIKPANIRILRSEEHTSELQSLTNLVCRLLLEKKKTI